MHSGLRRGGVCLDPTTLYSLSLLAMARFSLARLCHIDSHVPLLVEVLVLVVQGMVGVVLLLLARVTLTLVLAW